LRDRKRRRDDLRFVLILKKEEEMLNFVSIILDKFIQFYFSQMNSAALLLLKQLRELNRHPVEGISAGLIDESNPYAWNVILVGPTDTLYEGKIQFNSTKIEILFRF
jgi:hypothetical protein